MFRKFLSSFLVVVLMVTAVSVTASAASLELDGKKIYENIPNFGGTTYVPLRSMSVHLDSDAQVSWTGSKAIVETDSVYLEVVPNAVSITANGKSISVPQGVKLIDGTTYIPVRAMGEAFGVYVDWDGIRGTVIVSTSTDSSGGTDNSAYDEDELYWMSRIISAEAAGEPFDGKVAVGNVIMNRVESNLYPDTIYEVIFDRNHGVQFEPILNGSIYNTPTNESIEAAKRVLDGVNVVGDALFFLNPDIAQSSWIVNNREFLMSIGDHDFYA